MSNFRKILDTSRESTNQFMVLSRHFYFRLFLNDVVSFKEQMKEKVIGILAILAIFSAHLSNVVLFKYAFIPDEGISWVEKCYLMSFFMVLMGFITVLEWDVIFPDSRDFSNLMPLPIKLRTLFAAKFASLCLFAGLFALGMNAISTFAFWFYLPKWQSSSVFYGIRFIIVHLVSVFAANYFIFFCSVLMIGMLMSILGYRIFNRISIYIRALLMIAFVFLMVFFLAESVHATQSFSSFPVLKENNSLFLYLFPPMWFVGLYETLLGSKDLLFLTLSKLAVLALIVPAVAFFLTAALGYKRHLKKRVEEKKRTGHLFRLKTFLMRIFNDVFLRNPVQRAVFYFFGKTLRRSILHKMRLATYMAVSGGLILVILATNTSHINTLFVVNKTLLSIPLILSFFLLVGMRSIINIPAAPEANWIFKLTERRDKRHYFSGLRRAIFFFTLVPLFVVLFVFYSFLWGWNVSLYHCLYGLFASFLLMEILFQNYRKIPFACSYLPGKAKLHVLWIFYFLSFLVYVFLLSSIEYKLLEKPSNFLVFYGIVFGVLLASKIYQNYFLYRRIKILYEEKPEPVMVTLIPYDLL